MVRVTSIDTTTCEGCGRPDGVDCHPFCEAGEPTADVAALTPPPELVEGVVVETVPTCAATAAHCHCGKPFHHVDDGDTVHDCGHDGCQGQWAGDFAADSFRPIRMPYSGLIVGSAS